ncbi:hypothetical protein [Maridesulfovibrio sp.]|uniref:hypothetical protein n=2 Tax=Maridesulfovibrio TaxID=2794998 RepID=UPI003B00E229
MYRKWGGFGGDRFDGFSRYKGFGYALLVYFTTIALDLNIFPRYQDRVFFDCMHSEHRMDIFNARNLKLLKELSSDRINDICAEIRELYSHVQRNLKNAGLKEVRLRREIKRDKSGYLESWIKLKKNAEAKSQKKINVHMDVLNSFGEEGAYKQYKGISLELTIPIEEVFYCSNLVGDCTGEKQPMETGEWVILNRSFDGIASIPTSSIKITSDEWNNISDIDVSDPEAIVKQYNPMPVLFERRDPSCCLYGTHGLKRKFRYRLMYYLEKIILGTSKE